MTGHDERDPRLDIQDEAASGGGPELMPATDENAGDPAERGWVNPNTQDVGRAGGAADGRPTPGAQIEPGTADPGGKIWPDRERDDDERPA